MSRLNAVEVDEFRGMLLQKRAEILGDVHSLTRDSETSNSSGSGSLSSMPQHMADLGSDNYEQEFSLVLVVSERRLLDQIEAALERIAKKTFGICEATLRPIGKARLRAQPWARYCYDYVLEQERLGRPIR